MKNSHLKEKKKRIKWEILSSKYDFHTFKSENIFMFKYNKFKYK